MQAVDDIDIVDLLSKVSVPTIVFHCIHDKLVPFDQGRRLAASIPNAGFVPLDSENHVLLADEPAWAKFVGEMEAFLSESTMGRRGTGLLLTAGTNQRGFECCDAQSTSGRLCR